MSTDIETTSALHDPSVPVKAKLAAAWTSFVFLYVYVDIFGFYKPGVIDDILAGVVWEFDIGQAFVTVSLALMVVPILMVFLSMTLPARSNRATNLIVASVYVPVSAFTALGESWTYFYGFAVALEVIVLAGILRYAWTWPRGEEREGTSASARRRGLRNHGGEHDDVVLIAAGRLVEVTPAGDEA